MRVLADNITTDSTERVMTKFLLITLFILGISSALASKRSDCKDSGGYYKSSKCYSSKSEYDVEKAAEKEKKCAAKDSTKYYWENGKCKKYKKLKCYKFKESSKSIKCKSKKVSGQQCSSEAPYDSKSSCTSALEPFCDSKGSDWGMKGTSCKKMKPKDICTKKNNGHKYVGDKKTYEASGCLMNKAEYEDYKCNKKNKNANPPKYEIKGNVCKKIKKNKCYELVKSDRGSKCKTSKTFGVCTEQGLYDSKDSCRAEIEKECRAKESEGYVYKSGKCKKLSEKKKCKAEQGFWYTKAKSADGTNCFKSKEEVEQIKCDEKNSKSPGKYAMQNGKCKKDKSAKEAYKKAKKDCKAQGMKASKNAPYACEEDPKAAKKAAKRAQKAMKKECKAKSMKVSTSPDANGEYTCVEDDKAQAKALKKEKKAKKKECKKQGMGVSDQPNASGEFECVEDEKLKRKADKKLAKQAKKDKKKECKDQGMKVSSSPDASGNYTCVIDPKKAKKDKKKECKALGKKVSSKADAQGNYTCEDDPKAMIRKKKAECRDLGKKYDKKSGECIDNPRQFKIAKKRFCKTKSMKYESKKDKMKTELPEDGADPESHGCVVSKREQVKQAKKACLALDPPKKYDKKSGECVDDVKAARKEAKCQEKIKAGKNVKWEDGKCRVDKTAKNEAKLDRKKAKCEKKAEKKKWFYFDESDGKCKINQELKDEGKIDSRKAKCEQKAQKNGRFTWNEETKRCDKGKKVQSDAKCASIKEKFIDKLLRKIGRKPFLGGITAEQAEAKLIDHLKKKNCDKTQDQAK